MNMNTSEFKRTNIVFPTTTLVLNICRSELTVLILYISYCLHKLSVTHMSRCIQSDSRVGLRHVKRVRGLLWVVGEVMAVVRSVTQVLWGRVVFTPVRPSHWVTGGVHTDKVDT